MMTITTTKYKFTKEQKSLLRDLIIYYLGMNDSLNIKNRIDDELNFLKLLNDDNFNGDIGTAGSLDIRIIGFCDIISDAEKFHIKKGVTTNKSVFPENIDIGLKCILSMYTDETINGLKETLLNPEISIISINDLEPPAVLIPKYTKEKENLKQPKKKKRVREEKRKALPPLETWIGKNIPMEELHKMGYSYLEMMELASRL